MTNPENITVIHKVQQAIIERLKQWLASDFYIAPFPADTNSFDPAQYNNCCLVHLAQSKYDTKGSAVRQMRVMEFQIVLHLRDLVKSEDAYTAIEMVRKALQFQTLEGSQPIQMVHEKLESEQQGTWTWSVQVAVTVPAFAAQTNRKVSPILPNQEKESA